MTQSEAHVLIPPVLKQRPRRVKRRSGGCGVWFLRLFILPHTLVGIGALLAIPVLLAWACFGAERTAQVVSAEARRTTVKNKPQTNYHITYVHQLNGKEIRKDTTISQKEFQRIGGEPGPVLEKPKYADIRLRSIGSPPLYWESQLDPDETVWPKVSFMLLWAGIWNSILSIFVYIAWIHPWRMRRLYRNGKAAPGVITGKNKSGNKSTRYYVQYEFVGDDLKTYKGKCLTSSSDYDRAQIGTFVTVLHHDGKSKPSVAYEYGDYRCE